MIESCSNRFNFSHKMPKALLGCSVIASGMLLLTATTQAAVINVSGGGVYNISNVNGTLVSVSTPCINWANGSACQSTTGVADQGSGDPAVFSIANGTIKDLMQGQVFPLVDFETATGPQGLVHFDLINLLTATNSGTNDCSTGTVGSNCAPGAGSPFFLHQASANSVSITLNVILEAYTGTSGTAYNAATLYTGLFTTQISGNLGNGAADTIPNILAYELGGGAITATWSAAESPVPAVPEPMSLFLMGSGLLGVAFAGRRFRRS